MLLKMQSLPYLNFFYTILYIYLWHYQLLSPETSQVVQKPSIPHDMNVSN